MATFIMGEVGSQVGAAVGSAFGPAGPAVGAIVGRIIGSSVGAYYDVAMFAPDPMKLSPSNRDLRVSPTDEGAALATAFGTTRVLGFTVWCSRLREHSHGGGGGKGGAGNNVPRYTYAQDIAFGVCAGEVEAVEEILCNGKRIYSISPEIVVDNFAVQAAIKTTEQHSYYSYAGWEWTNIQYLELKSPLGGPDLTQFAVGTVVNITGWTAPYTANNTDPLNTDGWKVFSTRWDDDTDESYLTIRKIQGTTTQAAAPVPTFPQFYANFPDGTGGQTIRIQQPQPLWGAGKVDQIIQYRGQIDQPVDPTIEAREPEGAMAFRFMTYIVLVNLQLQDFGNGTPAQIEAIVRVKTSHPLGEVISYIAAEAGYEPSEIDVTALDGIVCRGYCYYEVSAATALQDLLLAYDVLVQKVNGVYHFFPRADAETVVVDEADLAYHELGADVPRPVQHVDSTSLTAPREFNLMHIDPDRKYQSGGQRVRLASGGAHGVARLDTQVVLPTDEAHAMCARMLWMAHTSLREISVSLPPKFIESVRENVRLSFSYNSQPYLVLLNEVDRGDNGLVSCVGIMEEPRLLNQPQIGTNIGTDQEANAAQPQFTSPVPHWWIIDCACLRDEDADQPGFYLAMTFPSGVTDGVVTCGLYESQNDGASWTRIGDLVDRATIGICSTIAHDEALTGFWDDTTVLDFTLVGDGDVGLESVTDLECLNGSNRFVYGNEIIGAANVELIGYNTYRATRLLRGLQGTEAEIAAHAVGDRIICITNPGVVFVPRNSAAIGQTRLYAVVPAYARIVDCDQITHTLFAANAQPLPPINVRGSRDASNNLTVTFTWRGRGLARLLAPGVVPACEERLFYQVDIMDPVTPTTRVRRFTPEATEADVVQAYTAANQTTDGYTPGDPVTVQVRQGSKWVGAGRTTTATI